MTGRSNAAMSSAGGTRPWRIDNVCLFDARQLLNEQRSHGVKVGIASSVPNRYWTAAEIYPTANCPLLDGTPENKERRCGSSDHPSEEGTWLLHAPAVNQAI